MAISFRTTVLLTVVLMASEVTSFSPSTVIVRHHLGSHQPNTSNTSNRIHHQHQQSKSNTRNGKRIRPSSIVFTRSRSELNAATPVHHLSDVITIAHQSLDWINLHVQNLLLSPVTHSTPAAPPQHVQSSLAVPQIETMLRDPLGGSFHQMMMAFDTAHHHHSPSITTLTNQNHHFNNDHKSILTPLDPLFEKCQSMISNTIAPSNHAQSAVASLSHHHHHFTNSHILTNNHHVSISSSSSSGPNNNMLSFLLPLKEKIHLTVFDVAHHGHPKSPIANHVLQHGGIHRTSTTAAASASSHSGVVSNLLKSYSNLLHENPVSTKAITASCLAIAGDAIAQTATTTGSRPSSQTSSTTSTETDTSTGTTNTAVISTKTTLPPSYDVTRGLSFALFGATYTGAFQHYWFEWLNTNISSILSSLPITPALVTPTMLSSPTVLAIAKLSVNQFLMAPIVYMPLFLTLTSTLMGLSMQESKERLQNQWFKLLTRNWGFWLPVQFIQFSFIDPEWQIPYLCAAGLVWTTILSLSSDAGSSSTAATTTMTTTATTTTTHLTSSTTATTAGTTLLQQEKSNKKNAYVGIMGQGFVW